MRRHLLENMEHALLRRGGCTVSGARSLGLWSNTPRRARGLKLTRCRARTLRPQVLTAPAFWRARPGVLFSSFVGRADVLMNEDEEMNQESQQYV
jgi:hypothetical protein